MYVEASFDGGRTWNGSRDGSGEPVRVNADRGTHFFPAVVAGRPGRVGVAYIATRTRIATLPYGKPAPGGGDGARWFVYAAFTPSVRAKDPDWQVSRITRRPIHVGDVCTLGIFCSVFPTANRDLLDFIDAALDGGGRLHVAYTNDRTKRAAGIYVANQTGGPSLTAP